MRVWVWLNLMIGVPSVQFRFLKSHQIEKEYLPPVSAAGTFTGPWEIDSMVVGKEPRFGGRENLSFSCPGDATQGTSPCVLTPSGPSCVE